MIISIVLRRLRLPLLACALVSAHAHVNMRAQVGSAVVPARAPRIILTKAIPIQLPGRVDSNSPAVWDDSGGRDVLRVFTSFAGLPSVALGADLQRMGAAKPVVLNGFAGGGYWLEAVVGDVDGTLYGYYHNERAATACADSDKVVPRIGAARSTDQGATWEDLGTLIEAPPGTLDCETTNQFFVGGVGDLSVVLDPDSRDLYIFYSEYLRMTSGQGVGVARLLWADRDDPVGRVMIWREGVWQPARRFRQMRDDGTTATRFVYPAATPLFPTNDSWHDDNTSADAFWGPSVHWNTYLQQYVMMLNRAKNSQFDQEGIYASFSTGLEDPASWSPPEKVFSGGYWYPQILGLEQGLGTDTMAGEKARLFMMGRSEFIVQFVK